MNYLEQKMRLQATETKDNGILVQMTLLDVLYSKCFYNTDMDTAKESFKNDFINGKKTGKLSDCLITANKLY